MLIIAHSQDATMKDPICFPQILDRHPEISRGKVGDHEMDDCKTLPSFWGVGAFKIQKGGHRDFPRVLTATGDVCYAQCRIARPGPKFTTLFLLTLFYDVCYSEFNLKSQTIREGGTESQRVLSQCPAVASAVRRPGCQTDPFCIGDNGEELPKDVSHCMVHPVGRFSNRLI